MDGKALAEALGVADHWSRSNAAGIVGTHAWAMATLAAEVRRLAAAVPAGCVRDETGVDRQVLGTLITTDDGAVIGDEAVVVDLFGDVHMCYASHEEPCYSTKEAAEAARERGGT